MAVSGSGFVFALTRLHQGPPVPGVSYSPPLPLAVIELDEQPGLRVVGTLAGEGAQSSSVIDERVELTWPAGLIAPRLAFSMVSPR
jgi:uncharacterized OB-fold protein